MSKAVEKMTCVYLLPLVFELFLLEKNVPLYVGIVKVYNESILLLYQSCSYPKNK